MENELTCCVCLDLYTEPLMLPCSHNFCKKCLYDLFHHSRVNNQDRQRPQITCPKCRREVQWDPFSLSGIDNLPLNKALDNVVRVYKTTYRDEARSNLKKCFTHVKPLSLYCQTCKRSVCEDCVLQAHSGFGHLVKELEDFIQEEKDKARASIQEIEAIKTNLIARDSEATTLIVNSKTLELQMRKTVDDQFEMIKTCVSTQHTKTLDNLSAQMSESRAHLEKLSSTYSTLRSDIRVLRNSHKDALQETNPERQLKLLQGLTLRLSTFLTFRSSSLPGLPTTNTEQDGHIEHLEEVLKAVRELTWTNTSPQRGDEKAQTRDWTTQTDSKPTNPSIVVQNGHQTAPTRGRWSKYSHPEAKHADPKPRCPDRAEVTSLLDNAVRELRQLTGGGTESVPQEDLLSETVEKLQHLYLDHYRENRAPAGLPSGSVPDRVSASVVETVSQGNEGRSNISSSSGCSTGAGGVFGPGYFSTSRQDSSGGNFSLPSKLENSGGGFSLPSRPKNSDGGFSLPSRPDTSGGGCVNEACPASSAQPSLVSERQAASSRSSAEASSSQSVQEPTMSAGHDILSQNGNGPKADNAGPLGPKTDNAILNGPKTDNSGILGCTSGFHFRKSIQPGHQMNNSAPPHRPEEAAGGKLPAAVAKSETLKLYFGQKTLSEPRPAPSASSSTSAASPSLPPSTQDGSTLPVNQPLVSAAAGNTASDGLQALSSSDRVSSDSDSFTLPGVSTSTGRPEAGAAGSPGTPLFVGPSAEVAQTQCCGVGARPKVRMNSAKPLSYHRNLSAGALCSGDPRDERRMGASLKEGLSSAVCTIRSLCRVGFNAGHRDSSLDVNANDNGAAGAATPDSRSQHQGAPPACSHDGSHQVAAPGGSQEREYSRTASAPAALPGIEGASGHEAERRSVGTSPVSFNEPEPEPSSQPSVWNTFSFNDASKPASLDPGALGVKDASETTQQAALRVNDALSSARSTHQQELLPLQPTLPPSTWWHAGRTPALQSTLPDLSQSAGLTSGRLTSLTQLPKWDSSQSGVAQTLSKVDLSQFWTPGVVGVRRDPEQVQAARGAEAAAPPAGAVCTGIDPRPLSLDPSTSDTAGLALPNRPFDFVGGAAASRQTSLGSPKFKQRRYQKGRKRNQNSK